MGAVAALTAVSMVSKVGSGIASMSAARQQANSLQEQADIALQESRTAAFNQARDVTTFQSGQEHAFLDSGVQISGSPLAVLEQTRLRGQQEVDAISRSGVAQSSLLQQQASQTKRAGLAAFLGSIAGAAGEYGSTTAKAGKVGSLGNAQISLQAPVPPVPLVGGQ